MKKMLFITVSILLLGYITICILLYIYQERIIFFPEKLSEDYPLQFPNAEELKIKTSDGISLHGILFKADSASKGVIFYLHGNAGSLRLWGDVASTYTALRYDVFMLDYRGYGKSEGQITSQEQMFDDVETVYKNLLSRYSQDKIIILGYSIGTGVATYLASVNKPKMLILQAPYYNMAYMMKQVVPFAPTFILKYKFETNKFIQLCSMPIVIFHGDSDEVIPYGSSLKLKPLLKESDTLITLYGQGHKGMSYQPQYIDEIDRILNQN
ncbi:MAG TPA: alpha/beta fold hydrolase [Cyclobacteriaceae bacterium]